MSLNLCQKITRNVYEVLITFAIFLGIPLIIFVLVTSRTNAILGIRSYVVQTGSMQPKLPIGSIVFAMDARNYAPGDIITFNRGDITVTHRIVALKDGKFETKGDANNSADPQLVALPSVIGRDFFDLPVAGKFINFIRTAPGFLLLVVLPNLIFIGFEIRNILAEYRKNVERKLLERLRMS